MSKMIKYEYRKNIGLLLMMLCVYVAIELYFICSVYVFDTKEHVAASLTLMVLSGFATYFFVLLSSVMSYSRELKQKSGYLVFMTPVSTFKILGAKLITTFINGVVLVCGIVVMLTVGFEVANAKYGLKSGIRLLEEIIDNVGNFKEIIAQILAFIIMLLVIFYMTITVAYLAVSLCATVFENRKGKGIISIIVFVLIFVCAILVADNIPLTDTDFPSEITSALVSFIPRLLWFIAVSVLSFFASAALLEKKISL